LVFQPLSQPLLEHFFGRHVASKAPPSLLAEASEFRGSPDESIVVLSQVLAADITFGYHSSFCRLKSVNGIEIQNIYHLAEVCDNCTDEFVQFDTINSAPLPA
jgi:PDZ domain